MRQKLVIFFASAFILFAYGEVYALPSTGRPPSEMVVLTFPDNSYANWKEVSRHVTEKEGMVEWAHSHFLGSAVI